MKNFIFLGLVCLGALACSSRSGSKNEKPLSVPQLFTDHMVLQQKQKVAFWGTATPQKEVEVSTGWGNNAKTVVDSDGRWKLQLQTPAAGGPYDIQITSGDDRLAIKDVLIGEVWLASGQSNMEMPLSGWPPNDTIVDSSLEIAEADLPKMPFITREWGDTWLADPDTEDGLRTSRIYTQKGLLAVCKIRQDNLNGNSYWDHGGLDANPRISGYFLWSYNDYPRGYDPFTAFTGVVDIDRYEKQVTTN